ncbi:MAG: hypothetical protein HN623_07590, partial [Bdellovibrionales bacterium]|nr:hypothetical protein [Bdellovibrionales bacterium]
MKSNIFKFIALITFITQGIAIAGTIDLKPIGLSYRKGLDDDISMHYSQHLYIKVKNVGTEDYTHVRGYSINLKINGQYKTGYIYGPDHLGGALGGRIRPGAIGKIFFRLPLNSIARCASTRVHIDTNRRVQKGAGVYSNDRVTLLARDRESNMRCFYRIP